MTYWLLPFTAPTYLQGYLVGLLSMMVGLTKSTRFHAGVLQLSWRPWFEKHWRYSTTIGACMGLHSKHGRWTEWHEWRHISQYEDENLRGAIAGGLLCIIDWRIGLVVWATSGALWLLPNFISGWIRHGDPYMGSEHELSAYSQTYRAQDGG